MPGVMSQSVHPGSDYLFPRNVSSHGQLGSDEHQGVGEIGNLIKNVRCCGRAGRLHFQLPRDASKEAISRRGE